ncbi:hypothetical protein Clacol_001414 [Clathrus columnatus]|uniref:Uncharacterized protein n=1 Tax=Clathrus columnatus TaxID=1419009 RepID=A0AAV4ZY77_9AGAM|nr:hypothetical protein Clacol_001414 [Clathrus columnatus]
MQFHNYLAEVASAVRIQDGEKLGSLLSISGNHVPKLLMGLHDSSRNALSRYIPSVIAPWGEIAVTYVQVIVYDDEPENAYKEHDTLVNTKEDVFTRKIRFMARFFKDTTSWALPTLYVLLQDLRKLAEKADSSPLRALQGARMEDAARTCNKAFSICISDRNPLMESRRWGTYYLAGVVMKCYFKAEEDLTAAFDQCHHSDRRNQERISTYLIPLRLLKGQIPSRTIISRFPALDALYGPFLKAAERGNLAEYDAALDHNEARLFRLGVWYIWEKAREICLRGLFRNVWLAMEQSTRIPVESFRVALQLSTPTGQRKEGDEVILPPEEAECLVANMIHKGYVRGYISHERGMVVLSAKTRCRSVPRLWLPTTDYIIICASFTSMSSPASPDKELSKSARKKLLKAERYALLKAERRARDKQKKHLRAEKRKADPDSQSQVTETKKRKVQGPRKVFKARIIIDLGFDELMSEKVLIKTITGDTLNSNRHSCNMFESILCTSLNGKTLSRLHALGDQHKCWKRVQFLEDGYETLWSTNNEGSDEPVTAKESLVYLTGDSNEELLELKEGETYIIGGICDHNRYKRPNNQFVMQGFRLLTIHRNQVFDILLEWVEHRDWEKALHAVMPKRKFNQTSKRKSASAQQEESDAEDDSNDGPASQPDYEGSVVGQLILNNGTTPDEANPS